MNLIFKRIFAAICASALCTQLSGCGENTVKNSTAATSSVAETTAAATLVTGKSDVENNMIAASLADCGNGYRLSRKLGQIKNGGEATVAFIGGSITEGYTVSPDECYAKLSYDYIASLGESGKVKYVNAGLSGTPSILGNLRLERDVLSQKPDIVFVEFAVNDGGDINYKEAYESLVRTVLEQDNEPAVVLLFMRTKQGYSAQDYMKEIGRFYSLPMISAADALSPALESGVITWESYYNDDAHPNPNGHRLISQFIENCICKVNDDTSYTLPDTSVNGTPYKNAHIYEADYDNSNNPDFQIESTGAFNKSATACEGFSKGWAYDSNSDGAMKFSVKGNSLFLVCKRNKTASMGKADVYINGNKACTVNTCDKDGWGEPFAYKIIKWQEVKTMDVEIRINDESTDKTFEIMAIGYSAN